MHDSEPDDQLIFAHDDPAACTQCHNQERFNSKLTEHTHHPPASAGSNCLNCHMPHTTYALFKGIRSHQIQSPQVRSSVRHGVPNACNLCHLDRTLDWTQQHLADWYEQPLESLTDEQRENPASVLWLLKGHAAQRVIAAWHYGWPPAREASGTNWLAPFVAQLLADDYGPVRHVAARSLKSLPGFADFPTRFVGAKRVIDLNRREAVALWETLNSSRPVVQPFFNDAGRLDSNRIARRPASTAASKISCSSGSSSMPGGNTTCESFSGT
jgi:hypothetical protein